MDFLELHNRQLHVNKHGSLVAYLVDECSFMNWNVFYKYAY
jgi:hypothetical protein